MGKWIAYSRLMDNQMKSIFVYEVSPAERKSKWQILWRCDFACFGSLKENTLLPRKYWFWIWNRFGSNMSKLRSIQVTRHFISPFLNAADSSPLPFLKVMRKTEKTEEKKKKRRKKATVLVTITEAGIQKRIVAIDILHVINSGLANAPENQDLLHGSCSEMKELCWKKYDFDQKRKSEGFSFQKVTQVSFPTTVNPTLPISEILGNPETPGSRLKKVGEWGSEEHWQIDESESRPHGRMAADLTEEGWRNYQETSWYVGECSRCTLEWNLRMVQTMVASV